MKKTIFTVGGVNYNVSVYAAGPYSQRGSHIIHIENPERSYIKGWNYFSGHVFDKKSPSQDSFQYKIFSYAKQHLIPSEK